MEEQRIAKAHKLVVNNRKTSMVTGVLDVLSFDLNEILLETEQGMLMVKGTDLHVNRLSVERERLICREISTALLIPVPLRQRKQEKISCPGCSGRRERCRDLEQRQ